MVEAVGGKRVLKVWRHIGPIVPSSVSRYPEVVDKKNQIPIHRKNSPIVVCFKLSSLKLALVDGMMRESKMERPKKRRKMKDFGISLVIGIWVGIPGTEGLTL